MSFKLKCILAATVAAIAVAPAMASGGPNPSGQTWSSVDGWEIGAIANGQTWSSVDGWEIGAIANGQTWSSLDGWEIGGNG